MELSFSLSKDELNSNVAMILSNCYILFLKRYCLAIKTKQSFAILLAVLK